MNGRRDFLKGLAALPLIGGGVTLIGQPTASAEPVTPDLLEAYKTWLHYENRWLAWEMAGDPVCQRMYSHLPADDRVEMSRGIRGCLNFVGQSGSYHGNDETPSAYSRAALVLSTVGCDWREARL